MLLLCSGLGTLLFVKQSYENRKIIFFSFLSKRRRSAEAYSLVIKTLGSILSNPNTLFGALPTSCSPLKGNRGEEYPLVWSNTLCAPLYRKSSATKRDLCSQWSLRYISFVAIPSALLCIEKLLLQKRGLEVSHLYRGEVSPRYH